jgi:hypothetical protein
LLLVPPLILAHCHQQHSAGAVLTQGQWLRALAARGHQHLLLLLLLLQGPASLAAAHSHPH